MPLLTQLWTWFRARLTTGPLWLRIAVAVVAVFAFAFAVFPAVGYEIASRFGPTRSFSNPARWTAGVAIGLVLLFGASALSGARSPDSSPAPSSAAVVRSPTPGPTPTAVATLASQAALPTATPGPTLEPTPTAEPTPTPAPTPEPTPTPAPTPITLTGSGDRVVPFTAPEDAALIARIRYSGGGNFAVWSIASDGSMNDLLVNTIGSYEGTVLFDETFGTHSVAFQVESEGSWSIAVYDASAADTWDTSITLHGSGDYVMQLDQATSGFTVLDATYSGDGNFAVWSYGFDSTDLLINEIGAYDGQSILSEGTFLLEITAEGAWTMAISR